MCLCVCGWNKNLRISIACVYYSCENASHFVWYCAVSLVYWGAKGKSVMAFWFSFCANNSVTPSPNVFCSNPNVHSPHLSTHYVSRSLSLSLSTCLSFSLWMHLEISLIVEEHVFVLD